MKDFLKKFQTTVNYNTWKSSENYIEPNVSYITENGGSVEYNPIQQVTPSHNYEEDYFTIVAKESGTITFTYDAGDESSTFTSMSYSKNNGEWVTTNYDSTNGNIITINVSNGDKVRWKGINNAIYYGNLENINFFSSFTSSCFVDIEGNIMSLLFDDNFIDKINLTGKLFAFISIFINQYNQSILKIISAKNLILPATSLSDACYAYMFYGCTSLTTAPELPATTLANSCYAAMFYGCTALTTTPELPATTLTNVCYDSMFRGCTALTVAPTLPATTLADQCYSHMFEGCTSLMTAPQLPATTLVQGCYSNMFNGCTSLTTAPQLPATTLTDICYYMMFSGCNNLSTITCLATDISASNCTSMWVGNVAASGTFIKDANTSWSSKVGTDGIPFGWTVQDAA